MSKLLVPYPSFFNSRPNGVGSSEVSISSRIDAHIVPIYFSNISSLFLRLKFFVSNRQRQWIRFFSYSRILRLISDGIKLEHTRAFVFYCDWFLILILL